MSRLGFLCIAIREERVRGSFVGHRDSRFEALPRSATTNVAACSTRCPAPLIWIKRCLDATHALTKTA